MRKAISWLVEFDNISVLANLWMQEVSNRHLVSPETAQQFSIQIFTTLHTSLKKISESSTSEFVILSDFQDMLQRSNGKTWGETFSHIKHLEISLLDTLQFCMTLREVTLNQLKDAGLLEIEQYQGFVYFFDWLLIKLHKVWEIEESSRDVQPLVPSLDIDMLRSIAESVKSPVDLNPVLQAIVERVRESGLWPMCAIGSVDPDDQEIQVPAQSGFTEGYPTNIKFPADGSATMETIHRKRPIAIPDVYADHEFPVLREAAQAAGYRSILLVPIFVAGLQATVTFCSEAPHEFKESEIALANAIAQQVMIAIENAHRHHTEKQRVNELESLNRLIANQNRMLQRAVNTHTTLTKLVLDNAGIDRIMDTAREILGNPVAIEDEFFRLMIFSEDWQHFDRHRRDSIAAGGTPSSIFENQQIASILDEVFQHRRAMLLPVIPAIGIEKRRIVAPIIAGAEILGYVWVMESLRVFHEQQDLMITEQAALVMALEMMKQRATYETEMRLKADFLSDLLSESSVKESELLQRASYLGFNFNQASILIVIDVDESTWNDLNIMNTQARKRQLISRIQETMNQLTSENLVANQTGRIVVITPARIADDSTDQTLSQITAHIRQAIKQLFPATNVLIGIGDVFHHVEDARQSCLNANRALDAAKSLGKVDDSLRLGDLGIYGMLFRKGDTGELLNFARNSLESLMEYDREHGTELLKTLDVYLANQSRLAETARNLYIHVNTLRQRLDRIEQILTVNLKETFVVLNLQLALRILEASQRTVSGYRDTSPPLPD